MLTYTTLKNRHAVIKKLYNYNTPTNSVGFLWKVYVLNTHGLLVGKLIPEALVFDLVVSGVRNDSCCTLFLLDNSGVLPLCGLGVWGREGGREGGRGNRVREIKRM